MTRRTRGREIALQVLYQLDHNPDLAPEVIQEFVERRLHDPTLRSYAHALIEGVRSRQAHLDELIGRVAENWSVERMAAIDRNVLRLGAFEMLYRTEVPVKVVINEALELAKRYSTAQSSRFVNGILDRLQPTATDARDGSPPAEDLGAPTSDAPEHPADPSDTADREPESS